MAMIRYKLTRSNTAMLSSIVPFKPMASRFSFLRTSRATTPARSLLSVHTAPCLGLGQHKPAFLVLQRFASTKPSKSVRDRVIKPHPEDVSTNSSVRPVFGEVGASEGGEQDEDDVDTMASIKHDLQTIKETFALSEVPRDAFYLGMAGVLPYLATSLSTLYLAWDINQSTIYGGGFLMSGETAQLLLQILEPIQVGYGAVIISFLGAVHWGLEWAKYGGFKSKRRYAIGVLAPAVAWPTILMPVETALITQFLAFSFLYYADARASVRGIAPPWYSMYRFVLTFIVGASIVMSLVGRGQIPQDMGKSTNIAEKIRAVRQRELESVNDEVEERAEYAVANQLSEEKGSPAKEELSSEDE